MIEPYEFIDKNGAGEKERQLGATTELYNKLSAEETNNFRAKLNEIIDRVNLSDVPLFPLFALKFKGEGNLDLQSLEVGDIVHGFYDADNIWDNATYDGGDPEDKANYTRIVDTFEPELIISDGLTNDYVLSQSGLKVKALYLDRGPRYKFTEWEQEGDTITILGPLLAAGRKIYVTP